MVPEYIQRGQNRAVEMSEDQIQGSSIEDRSRHSIPGTTGNLKGYRKLRTREVEARKETLMFRKISQQRNED